ncbi:hypothetical protein NN3_16120 [Nocardia neocaledoniensis NBRC 108232]|uniref:Uncharacterized protein n=1 Tax=Nocardia neocaledoniensis TaxID=236511 RepID=A0A317P177_9NOCA|nr:hypothetical protein [Nocardia neocaledoniensis]PWV80852.1 hypothetical protein DFR69_101188 [Nocardia neocaledoniensis]GEM30605.1 hypothetical protein NN3_16120 [Nocardia neocaledoniensis NBRC 108232]
MTEPNRNVAQARGKLALAGGLAAVVLAPVAAAVTAAVYRFPVPLVGYTSGVGGALTAAVGSLFYLVLGGALVLAVVGALGGVLVTWGNPVGTRRNYLLAIGSGMVAAILGALGLALLEYVVGPW